MLFNSKCLWYIIFTKLGDGNCLRWSASQFDRGTSAIFTHAFGGSSLLMIPNITSLPRHIRRRELMLVLTPLEIS